MKSTCKATGVLGPLLGMLLLAAPAASAGAQQTQDSSRFSPTGMDSIGYSDSLARPGYRAMLEDTTIGLAGDSTTDSNRPRFSGDTLDRTGVGGGGGMDTTAIPGRRNEEDSSSTR
jgi:hypothetical protein